MVARYLAREMTRPQDMFEETPRPQIAVVCFNRSLVPMLQQYIAIDYEKITQHPLPDASVIFISHFDGLLRRHSFTPKETSDALKVMSFINFKDIYPLEDRATAYREKLETTPLTRRYTTIFVDEGQDLGPEAYKLLLEMLEPQQSNQQKNLIIFYDDSQNLYAQPRPNWKEIGIDLQGKRSKVMKVCYRNPREVVELALNVLLGTQAPEADRVQTRTYADINYLLQNQLVEDLGDHIHVKFTRYNGEKATVNVFETREQEVEAVFQQIAALIENDHIRPEDILVLFPSPSTYENTPNTPLEKMMEETLIEGVIQPYKPAYKDDYIFKPNHLTISTVHSAKGYDAPVVFLMGTDRFKTDGTGRATFYVAATRAKIKLYISGIQDKNQTLLDEGLAVNEMI